MPKHDLILLAMDASPTLDLMERALHASDYELATTHDHAGLDRIIQQSIPALMIIGEHLGGEDGFSISMDVLDRFPTMPIILYSEKTGSDAAAKVIRAGVSGFLHPPLRINDIVEEVQRNLSRASKLGRLASS
ncbi:MAG: response regulator [Anaerolineales bacterium]|nr:response regulator [Anaerolineales bacterium]